MTNRIAITVSKQGTEDTTAKTQTKGGSKGFLNMLMTAIGHQRKVKSAKGAHTSAANISAKNTAKNAACETGVAGKIITASKAETSKSKSSDLATKLAMPDNPLTISPNKPQATSKAGSANHADIKDTRHRPDTLKKTKDETGTAVEEAVVAVVSQTSPPTVPPMRPGSDKNASEKKGAEHYSDAHLHPVRLAGITAQAAIHVQQQSITVEHISEQASVTHQAVTTPRPHTGQVPVSKGSPPGTAADAGLAATNTPSLTEDGRIAPLADTNTASTAGKKSIAANMASAASSQGVTTAGASKVPVAVTTAKPGIPAGSSMAAPNPQPGHRQSDGDRPSHAADRGLSQSTRVSDGITPMAQADGTAMAAREAAVISTPHSPDGGKARAKHTTSTDTHAHADSAHPSSDPTAGAASQEGIRFYGRPAANAHGPSTLTKVTSKIGKPLHAIHAGPPPTASNAPSGQNTVMGHMPLATAATAGSQATANAHITASSQPMHASGPWTVMAAMQEIGQAAVNGHSRLELKLEPAHLGKVHVRIDSDAGKNIRVHLVVEQAASRQIIEQHLPSLRHALTQQGLNLGNFSMSSQQQGSGNGYTPDQHTQQSAPMHMPAPGETITPPLVNTANVYAASGRLSIRI